MTNSQMLTFIISIVTAGITAYITYIVSIKTSLRNRELELKREQAFKYFLPLKFVADELFHRLEHIEKKIVAKEDVNIQLPQNFVDKKFEWYFTDWINPENTLEGAGGYFLVTAMFMHAQLYYRINMLLKEYPFLCVQISESIGDYKDTIIGKDVKRIFDNVVNDPHTKKWVNLEEAINLKGKVKLEQVIKNVRLAAVMKGGIPYGLQPAFGQFLEKNVNNKIEQINYEEFVKLLMDNEQRCKFAPLHSFYSELIDKSKNVNEPKLIKLQALMISLLLFRNAEIA